MIFFIWDSWFSKNLSKWTRGPKEYFLDSTDGDEFVDDIHDDGSFDDDDGSSFDDDDDSDYDPTNSY